MPAYDFKAQFAEAVANGTKTQTIRRRRTLATKEGDRLVLYTGLRTKQCRHLLTAQCIAVTPITISANGVTLGGHKLPSEQELVMAQRDGFVSVREMLQFFEDLYGLPTRGLELIEWGEDSPLLPCRQCGKSTTILCEAAHCAHAVCFSCRLEVRIHDDGELIRMLVCEACMQARGEEYGNRMEVVE